MVAGPPVPGRTRPPIPAALPGPRCAPDPRSRPPCARAVCRPSLGRQAPSPTACRTSSSMPWSRTRCSSSRYLTTEPRVADAVLGSRVVRPSSRQGPGPVDGLGDPGRLVEAERPHLGDGHRHLPCQGRRHLGRSEPHDGDLALDVWLVDPVVEATALEGVVDVAGAVGCEHRDRRDRRARPCPARGWSRPSRTAAPAGTPRTRRRPGRSRR